MAPLRTFSRVSCVPAVSPWTRDSTGLGFYPTSPPLHGDLHCTCILLLIKSGTHGGSSGRERPTGITPRDLPLALPPLAGPVFHRSPVRGFLPITPSSLCAHPSAPALKRLRFRASHNQYSGHPEYRFTVTLSPHSVLRQISFFPRSTLPPQAAAGSSEFSKFGSSSTGSSSSIIGVAVAVAVVAEVPPAAPWYCYSFLRSTQPCRRRLQLHAGCAALLVAAVAT